MKALILAIVSVLVLARTSHASKVYTAAPPPDPLETSDLVIRGVIESLGSQWNDPYDPFSQPERTMVQVRQVLRGRNVRPRIGIIVADGRNLVPGNEYVICGFWRARQHAYLTAPHIGIYGRDGHQWIRDLGDRFEIDGDTLTDAEVRERVEKGSLKSVTTQSDVIVTGQVVSVTDSIFPGNDLHGTKVYRLQVTEALKGNAGKEIQMVVPSSVRSLYFRRTPQMTPGREWLCFLQKRNFGWYPFAGQNSLFEIRGEKLIYKNEVTCPRSRADTLHRIRRQARLEKL